MKYPRYYFLVLFAAIAITGCRTYHITAQSLQEQLVNANAEHKQLKPMSMGLVPAIAAGVGVTGNDLTEIDVLDKKGRLHIIPVTTHTGVRITRSNGKKKTFYFNTLMIKDGMVTGHKTHFFPSSIKPIPVADISKIELQR